MAEVLHIHPQNPQQRLLERAAMRIRQGAVTVYPTQLDYALGCQIGDKTALDRIRRIRALDEKHLFTLLCRDLSEIATYARVGNPQFRLIKSHTPGPYTFVLPATKEVPRRLMHPKRKTIGLRIPDGPIIQGLLAELAEPLMSTTLCLPDEDYVLNDPEEIIEALAPQVDLIIDGGYATLDNTTVIDLSGDTPEVLRQGAGRLKIDM